MTRNGIRTNKKVQAARNEIKASDVVVLRSNSYGPRMTVESICADEVYADVIWFDLGDVRTLRQARIALAALERKEDTG